MYTFILKKKIYIFEIENASLQCKISRTEPKQTPAIKVSSPVLNLTINQTPFMCRTRTYRDEMKAHMIQPLILALV